MLKTDWRDASHLSAAVCDQAKKPTACKTITTTVPDIMLQKPARTVANITNSKRRPTRRRARIVLRMMMKGAAKTRNGTAAKVDGFGPLLRRRKLAGRLVRHW